MTTSISTDVLAIVALGFTIGLARRNPVVNTYKNRIYISAAVITIVLLLLEIATIMMAQSADSQLVIPHRLANVIGFALSPLVPFIFVFFNNHKVRIVRHRFLTAPLYFNALLSILSYRTGWIFFVDAQNHYSRGSLFLLPLLVSLFYFGLIVAAVFGDAADYESDDKRVLLPILLLPLVGIVVQILFKELLLIWGSTSIALILVYIFLREQQFKLDVPTGMKNRAAFEKEMEQYLQANKTAALVVLDINNLKRQNDKFGHEAGDETIFQVAKILQECFAGVGVPFRIGGDEFCVICEEVSPEVLADALAEMERLLAAAECRQQFSHRTGLWICIL